MSMEVIFGIAVAVLFLGALFLTFMYLLFKKDEGEEYNAAHVIGLRIKS